MPPQAKEKEIEVEIHRSVVCKKMIKIKIVPTGDESKDRDTIYIAAMQQESNTTDGWVTFSKNFSVGVK